MLSNDESIVRRGRMWARAAALGAAAAATGLIGCAMPKPPPETAQGEYTGPAVTLGDRLGRHTARFECPTPGWSAGFDQLRDAPEGWTNAFITLREPSPIFVYPQVITSQEVMLDVPVKRPVRIYVRVLNHEELAEGPYRAGAASDEKPEGQPPAK